MLDAAATMCKDAAEIKDGVCAQNGVRDRGAGDAAVLSED